MHLVGYTSSFFFFIRWRYSPLWALACRTIPLHFSLSITNSLHHLTPSTWRSLSTSLHPFLGLPLRLAPSSSWVKILLGILSSSILSSCPSQLILCPFIHFTIFFPLLNSSSSRFVLRFHSPSSYLGPYILLNIFLSKISGACSSFFVIVHVSAPYVTTGLMCWLCYKNILRCTDLWTSKDGRTCPARCNSTESTALVLSITQPSSYPTADRLVSVPSIT